MAATLPSLLSVLPATVPAFASGPAPTLDLFTATVDGSPLSMAVLREGSPSDSRFFLSANRSDFHELAKDPERYPHETPGFHPILTRTPGLVPLVLLDDEHSVRLLRNDPGNPERLQSLAFLRHKDLTLRSGALFVFPDGEAPILEGGLMPWWNRIIANPLSFQIPASDMVHAVRRTVHKINNALSPVVSNSQTSDMMLEALEGFFAAAADSPAARDAMSALILANPAMREALDHVLRELPQNAAPKDDPFAILCAAMTDLRQLQADADAGTETIVQFTRMVSRRISDEVPLGILGADEVVRECEAAVEPLPVPPPEAPDAAAPAQAFISEPLLVVDDDAGVRRMLQDLLGRRGFKNIVAADSLSQALSAAETLPGLRVVVTDFNLSPTETGLDLARRLKKGKPGLRFVLITGNEGELKARMTAEEAGAFDRFAKPLDVSQLAERLRFLFQNSPKA